MLKHRLIRIKSSQLMIISIPLMLIIWLCWIVDIMEIREWGFNHQYAYPPLPPPTLPPSGNSRKYPRNCSGIALGKPPHKYQASEHNDKINSRLKNLSGYLINLKLFFEMLENYWETWKDSSITSRFYVTNDNPGKITVKLRNRCGISPELLKLDQWSGLCNMTGFPQ